MNQFDLFSDEKASSPENKPLAFRMAPRSLDEFSGQKHILGKGMLLRRAIEADRLRSAVFYGPPGSGKSALARIIAGVTQAHFETTNAVTAGINDIRRLIQSAKTRIQAGGRKTILLIDEIHHFNRSQQDALLPDVERGVITLIGITTENPYFYVNPALLSRSTLFELKPLGHDDLVTILRNALTDPERGLGTYRIEISDDAVEHLVSQAGGDARRLLNALEVGVLSTPPNSEGIIVFDAGVAEESVQQRRLLYDKSGDEHYDHASAFIKSMRGSDPDAALYWMAKMLAAGEDPRFVARRIVICASEDVGNADPHALMLAVSALNAIEFIGMPEGRIPLAQAAVYVACAPKSNACYKAIGLAGEEVMNGPHRQVPVHLRDATLDGAGRRGDGVGYKYPHDFPGNFVKQEYWPQPRVLYRPGDQGYEVKIGERMRNRRTETGTPSRHAQAED